MGEKSWRSGRVTYEYSPARKREQWRVQRSHHWGQQGGLAAIQVVDARTVRHETYSGGHPSSVSPGERWLRVQRGGAVRTHHTRVQSVVKAAHHAR